MASVPALYGAAYSVYTRICRLALIEKGVDHRLEEVDIFSPAGVSADYVRMHPFRKIPAFMHEGFVLYEAAAICRYVDEAFTGPLLQPSDAAGRARMTQITGLLDAYGFRPLILDIFVERIRAPQHGRASDEERIAAALAPAERCLDALAHLLADHAWLAGPSLSLADLHAAPMMVYFRMTPEGRHMLAARAKLDAWWSRLAARPSLRATISPLEA